MSNTLDWVRALHRTIMLAQLPHSESHTCSTKYPPSDLWKGALTRDLELAATDDENETRFVAIDQPGSNGAIFYSIPARRPFMSVDERIDSDSEVDVLIERNAVQVLLFPVAATSFITGQVMKAHLLSDPTICPKPRSSCSGFSLNSHALDALSRALQNGSSTVTPIQEHIVSEQLEPTPECAERVQHDRRDAARRLLVMRYQEALRDKNEEALRIAARLARRHSTQEEVKTDGLSLESGDTQAQRPSAISIVTKHTVPLVLPTRRHANPLSTVKSSGDRQSNENKQFKASGRAGAKGKENVFV
ncbi:hypothetical protein C8R45DRAFT_980957 [Mycena sanguinolenta]|nr:hypothetical protein C8R45DRAFT_980957 [Mycena sanguinolenta]